MDALLSRRVVGKRLSHEHPPHTRNAPDQKSGSRMKAKLLHRPNTPAFMSEIKCNPNIQAHAKTASYLTVRQELSLRSRRSRQKTECSFCKLEDRHAEHLKARHPVPKEC